MCKEDVQPKNKGKKVAVMGVSSYPGLPQCNRNIPHQRQALDYEHKSIDPDPTS